MTETRILLFNPPAPDGRAYTREGRCTQEAGVWGTQWPPLSLATAAALLRRDGCHVTLRDYPAAGLDSRALAEDVRRLRPAYAIWSTGTPTLTHDLALARLVRQEAPEAVTAVMGTHVTVRPEEALAEAALRAVIRGEPEGVIRDLCLSGDAFGDVAGISWRNAQDGAIRHNPDAALLDPEAIPGADWDGLDLDCYRLPLKGRRFLMVAPVRGCPWRCSFCTAPLYYGYRLRKRPVANVVGEMARNVERYGIREFFIWADTFTADRHYVRELCRAISDSGLRISWTCNSRVDTIDEETLRLMKAAGLWMISYGLESGSDAILAASGKGITVAQSREAVEMAHRLGIRVAGHFMFGLPGETEATMAETLDLALALPIDIAQFYVAAPFPGTALYDEARKEGWLRESPETGGGQGGQRGQPGGRPGLRQTLRGAESFAAIRPGAPPAASQSSAVMELPGLSPARVDAVPGVIPPGAPAAASQSSAVMNLPGLSAARVDAYRRHAYRRFYLRPRAAVRVLSMAEPSAVAGIMPPVRRFLRWMR